MNAWQITLKDLRLLQRDRRTLFILVALPLIFITILGLSTGQFLTMQDKNQLIQFARIGVDDGDLDELILVLHRQELTRRQAKDGDEDQWQGHQNEQRPPVPLEQTQVFQCDLPSVHRVSLSGGSQ